MRKTREQVWRELDELGEEEVRERLAGRQAEVPEPPLVHEWLHRRARIDSELAETSRDLRTRDPGGVQDHGRLLGLLILAAAAGFALVRALTGRAA